MGTSGAMDTSNQYIKYKITITQNWQDVSNNCTNVTVTVNFYRTNSGYQTYGTGTCYCKIDGTTYSASVSPSQKITNSGIDLFSKTITIYHGTDGSKYLDTSAWISLDTPLSSSEQWYGEWLPTIPRASQPSLSSSSITMGNSVTVYTNRASSSFTHILYWQINGGNWNWIVSNVATSYSWTIPLSFANNVPNATSLSVTVICETYNGSTYIGQKSVSLTANVPSNLVPTISNISLSESVSGIASKFGTYVQVKSQINGTVSASGTYSSTIKTYSITINGQSFSSSSFTTNALAGSGSCSITVTDTRNRTASNSQSYSVASYSNPSITNFTVVRCNSDGTENNEGAYAKCTMAAVISPVNNLNDKAFQLLYKKSADSSYTTVNLDSTSYSYNNSSILAADVNSEYDFIFRITDYFGSTEKTANLGTAFTLMDFNASGKSIAFGQVSTAASTDSKMQIKMNVNLNGDLSITNSLNTLINLGLTDVNTTDFSATGQANWLSQIQAYVVANLPYRKAWIFNAGYAGVGYGTAIAWSTSNLKFLMVFNETTGVRFYKYIPSTWKEVSATGATVLYSNTSGTNGTITLSETAANFSYLEIYFVPDSNVLTMTKVYNPNGKGASLSATNYYQGYIYVKGTYLAISGTSLTWSYTGWLYGTGGSSLTVNSNFSMSVTQIIGYR